MVMAFTMGIVSPGNKGPPSLPGGPTVHRFPSLFSASVLVRSRPAFADRPTAERKARMAKVMKAPDTLPAPAF